MSEEPTRNERVFQETVQASGPAERGEGPIRIGTQIGRLVVLRQLGGGGTGVVYLAYDRELDRKIALKFMRQAPGADDGGTAGRVRLMREAQALARLSHPNVVAIHDVGEFEQQVFIAEAFVDGATLSEWIAERPRSVGEILEVFAQAGRGLVAAHAAGLIHRDFKPGNVLVGRDGRVQVTDFGLARATTDDEPDVRTPVELAETSASAAGILSTPLTHTGAVMGTPAYMAPEQHLGQRADARTDQFNFCVSLWEMLYGERPFEGETVGQLARQVTQGKLRAAPKDTRVPPWIRRVLERGLRADPGERYPTMEALLAALARDPAVARRRIAAAAGVILLAAAVAIGVGLLRREQSQVCAGAERKLEGVWDAPRREAVRAAFLATGKAYAPATWDTVARTLDDHTRAWVIQHREACQATRVRGEQSEKLLDLRMRCLAERLGEVEALVDVLATADAAMLQRAVRATSALSSLAPCADAALLEEVLPPPRDLAASGRVEEVRARLARAKALQDAGKYAPAHELAVAAVADARAIGYRPLEAEAQYQLGTLTFDLGDYKASEATLHEALWAAMEGKHGEIEVKAALFLIHLVGYVQNRMADGHFWARYAWAALSTHGSDPALEARWHNGVAGVNNAEGDYDGQLEHNEKALALRQRAYGPDHQAVAGSLNNLGVTWSAKGDPAKALDYFQRAHDVFLKLYGPDHPDVALARMNLAATLGELGRFDDMRARAEEAIAGFERAVGEVHPMTAMARLSRAQAQHEGGQHAEALAEFRRALAVYEKTVGPEDADTAAALQGVSQELHCLAPDSREALEAATRALAILEKGLGADHPTLASALATLGEARLGTGDAAGAVGALERALALAPKAGLVAPDVAELRFGLARALTLAGGDRARARALAVEARDALRGVSYRARLLGEVEAWLRAHPAP